MDLSNIKPVNSGSVSIAEAIAKAKGIAAEKGVSYEGGRPGGSMFRKSLVLSRSTADLSLKSPQPRW